MINLIGLSTGLACALLIYLWVNDEMNMDKFHEQDSQLYQVMHNLDLSPRVLTLEETPTPLAEELKKTMPEIEYAISVNDFFNWQGKKGVFSNGKNQIAAKGLISSKDYFQVFSYDLIEGDKDQVLVDKSSIVISEDLANKLFSTTDNLIGKTLEWEHTGFQGTFQITGIFKTPSSNSTEQFDVVFNIEQLLSNDQWSKEWTGGYADTYVVLKKGTNLNQFNQKIKGLLKTKAEGNSKSTLFAQKYSDKYLHGQYENGKITGGRITYVRLFSLIAFFILLIACVNFMNLSTARASLKMKEIGIKKTIGASRRNLVFQFISESILISFLSLIAAVIMMILFLPQFNQITGKTLQLVWDIELISSALGITLLTGFIAGCYPAFYLSSFKSVTVLKGKLNISFGEQWIRKGLVVFQFALSILFIVGLLVVNEQIEMTQSKNLGYNRDNIISFEWKGNLYDQWNGLNQEGNSNEKFYSFMSRLKEVPEVITVTNMSGNILTKVYGQSGLIWNGDESNRNFIFKSPIIGYDFIETLGIELGAGRTFSKEHNDSYSKVILNEAAVKKMEIENPIGQKISMNGGSEIIGVVKNFHYGSLHNELEPLIFRFDSHGGNIMLKIKAGTETITIDKIKKIHQEFLPAYSFEFTFLDDEYQALYEAETKVSTLSKYFAGLAILISCLGLFGLAMFTAERRKKEIGIRKVLGSSVFEIVKMLTSDFTKTVIIAICISIPISYLIAQSWLDNFAYNITLTWWLFFIPALLVLFIAWATVGLQTIKAASANPVQSLKDE
ncbi:MAG: ABC transporter permease [Saprospiraceae bacterium]